MGPLDKDVVRDDALHATGDGFALTSALTGTAPCR